CPRAWVIALRRDGCRTSRRVKIAEVDAATRRARIAAGTSEALRYTASNPFVDDYLALVAELESVAPAGSLTGREAASLLRAVADRFDIETDSDLAAVNAIDEVAAMFHRAAWRFDVPAIVDALEQQQLRPTAEGQQPTIWAGDLMRF